MIRADLPHAAALAAMHAQAFPHEPWDEASFVSLLGMPGVFGLIDERGGFLLLRIVLDEAEIITIGVTTPRQGIGQELMRAGLELISAYAVKVLHLEVAAKNAPAQALYAKFGFTQAGRRKGYYADGDDALTMHLVLA